MWPSESACLCVCACVKVCSSNQALLLESCAVHRFFCITAGAGGLSLWLIDIWSFCLLHGGTIKAEGGKITGCSYREPDSSQSRQKGSSNPSSGGTMSIQSLVADEGAAELIRKQNGIEKE